MGPILNRACCRLARLGVFDFAGGLVVEMASGVSAFVLAFWVGPGKALHGGGGGGPPSHAGPHSLPLVLLGAGLLFFGWFGEHGCSRLTRATAFPSLAVLAGFNAGSALSAGFRASRAFANTQLAACSALATWGLAEWVWGGESKLFSGAY